MKCEIDKAVQLIKNDDVVAVPTETVYGLAASIFSEKGLKKIFATKQRPYSDPLIVHVSSIDQAKMLVADWHPALTMIAQKFWPGPLTLVVKKSALVSDVVTAGSESVAIRMPSHPLFLEIISRSDSPLAAPSANMFGKTSPTSASHVIDEFHDEVYVVDGGECSVGIESSVIELNAIDEKSLELTLLRPGHIQIEDIELHLHAHGFQTLKKEKVKKNSSPGQMKYHYMPAKPLILTDLDVIRLDEITLKLNELLQTEEGICLKRPGEILSYDTLILSDNPVVAAKELYSKLREASRSKKDVIIFKLKPCHATAPWSAVLERLTKAAMLRISC